MELWHKEEPALGEPLEQGAGLEPVWDSARAHGGDLAEHLVQTLHPNARQEEPTSHSICRKKQKSKKRVVTNLHVYGISLAESIYIYIYIKKK